MLVNRRKGRTAHFFSCPVPVSCPWVESSRLDDQIPSSIILIYCIVPGLPSGYGIVSHDFNLAVPVSSGPVILTLRCTVAEAVYVVIVSLQNPYKESLPCPPVRQVIAAVFQMKMIYLVDMEGSLHKRPYLIVNGRVYAV